MNTILCVEDEPALRADIVEELEDAGYKTLQACDGRQGLEMILAHKPDMVVSDITMPNMNGDELLQRLREDYPKFSEMPFIFLSALSDRVDVLSGVQLGADDYLTKPIDYEMLHAKVAASLRQCSRMLKQKEADQIKLFNAMNKVELPDGFEHKLPTMKTRNMVLVGEGNKEMWKLQNFLETVGHSVRVFTSGNAYLYKVNNEDLVADLTFLWRQSDDMQAPMIRQLAENKSGKYILVIPEHLHKPGSNLAQPGFCDSIGLPIEDGELIGKIISWTQPQKPGR